MSQYLINIKTLVNNISAIGVNIDVEDIILCTLNGFPNQYNAFKIAIRTKLTPI